VIKLHSAKYVKIIFIIPILFFLISFTLFPFFYSLFLSFSTVSLSHGIHIEFSGLQNWITLLKDDRFFNALKVTSFIMIIAVTIEYLIGFLLALFLDDEKIKAKTLFIVLFIIPMLQLQ